MLMEHELGRRLVREIRDSLSRYLAGGGEAEVDNVVSLCDNYVQLLRQHIYKENNVLFPLGDSLMSEDDDRETVKCYDERELPDEAHRRMEALAEQLSKKRR